jgi:hypothetical protein
MQLPGQLQVADFSASGLVFMWRDFANGEIPDSRASDAPWVTVVESGSC